MNTSKTEKYWQKPLLLLALSCACSAQTTNAQQQTASEVFSSLIYSVQSTRNQQNVDSETEETTDTFRTSSEYFSEFINPIIQGSCLACHQSGLVADQQGARLLFPGDTLGNEEALFNFLNLESSGADWLLGKISNEISHGGGRPAPRGSGDYNHFSEYLTLALGANTGGAVGASDFWQDTALEPRATTLRRAAFLLAGKVPTKDALLRSTFSEDALRAEIRHLMVGDGFHEFIVTAANDRLLTSGLGAGLDWQFSFRDRWPAMFDYMASLPQEAPDYGYYDKPFLTSELAVREFEMAVIQEPLELIAHIIETDRPYTEIVTADYTMVNAFSSIGYRSGATFEKKAVDGQGYYDRRALTEFKPGKNSGHIPINDEWFVDERYLTMGFSDYQEWPHAGVLSSPAFLGRYPSTDTNRNRARARWTYFHFLGVDIEKSAPRSTDPVALADKNNPTLNNPACTVCHERMDPVAGAYQSFGDSGHYLDSYYGKDSLPESYKSNERPIGERQELFLDPNIDPPNAWQDFTRYLDVSASGVNHLLINNDPDRCVRVQYSDDVADSEWFCTEIALESIALYQNGVLLESISAAQFESDPRFSVNRIIDQTSAATNPLGYLDTDDRGVPIFTFHSWLAFDFELEAGEYTFELDLRARVDPAQSWPFPRESTFAGLSWHDGFSAELLYEYGDTWYRDMRAPGFKGANAADGIDSIQWLGKEIAADPRFPKAAVKFWWSGIFGENPLEVPENPNLPNYDAQLSAYNEQQVLISDLAAGFVASNYNAKDLFADMLMSRWYRTSEVDAQALTPDREIALATVGSGRVLTPEELDRKTKAVFGRSWGEYEWGDRPDFSKPRTNLSSDRIGYGAFYGGIDGATIVKRNRDLTALMSNVVEKMAVEFPCKLVLEEFSKPRDERALLKYVEKTTDGITIATDSYTLASDPQIDSWDQAHSRSISFESSGGRISIVLRDETPQACLVLEEDHVENPGEQICSHIGLERLEIRRNGMLVEAMNADQFLSSEHFRAWSYEGGIPQRVVGWDYFSHAKGKAIWFAHPREWFAFDFDLEPGAYEVSLQLASGIDKLHPAGAVTVAASVIADSFTPSAHGSQMLASQVEYLLETATAKPPVDSEVEAILTAMSKYAAESQRKGTAYEDGGASCDRHEDIPFYQARDQYSEDDFWEMERSLKADVNGMMRAWAMVFSSIMTSHSYLHD